MGSNGTEISRRQFVNISTASGTGLLIGFKFIGPDQNVSAAEKTGFDADGRFEPNAWIKIEPDDTVTILVNHSEMGQGVLTALPMIIADEMEVDWSKVKSVHAPVGDVYKNPLMSIQMTAGSTSVRSSWDILRHAGASARQLFINAAAKTWNISPAECSAENSQIIHRAEGKKLRYGELINIAAKLPVPEDVPLKQPNSFNLIGKSIPRLDMAVKTDGSAVFGVDVKLPGLLTATVVHAPVLGARLISFNGDEAMKIEGVKQVLAIESGIAIVADTFWQAVKGAERVKAEWTEGHVDTADSETLRKRWSEMVEKEGKTVFDIGDVDEVFKTTQQVVEAIYELPYQAHATQEPMTCTVHVQEDRCDIWVPTQNQGGTHAAAVAISGLPPDKVHVNTTFVGGGLGRRVETDFVKEAVEISKNMGKPVKVIWTREEDTKNDVYRPASINKIKAVLDSSGRPIAWIHRLAGQDHFLQAIPNFAAAAIPNWFPGFLKRGSISAAGFIGRKLGAGKGLLGGAGPLPYDIKNVRVEYHYENVKIPVGFWRSVANSSNGFVVECFIDELAAMAGKDPFQYRLELLVGNPRLLNVLKLTAEKSGWNTKPPEGIFRGIASHVFHDTLIGMVAEISISKKQTIKVHRIVCGVDCGIVINPKIIKAQMESGIAFGLTATLKSSITLKKGKVEQSNFDDFELLRMDEMPEVEVYIVASNESPTGIGEAGVPTVAPAVANAVFAATGKRARTIPIKLSELA